MSTPRDDARNSLAQLMEDITLNYGVEISFLRHSANREIVITVPSTTPGWGGNEYRFEFKNQRQASEFCSVVMQLLQHAEAKS